MSFPRLQRLLAHGPAYAARALLACLALLLCLAAAEAHTVRPALLRIPLGDAKDIHIIDFSGCFAGTTVDSGNTAVADVETVVPGDGFGDDITYTVRAANSLPGNVPVMMVPFSVTWAAAGEPSEFCGTDDMETVIIWVTVFDPSQITSGNSHESGTNGDPIDTHTGEVFFHERPDLDLGGPMRLTFQRYYASRMRLAGVVGDMGDNWRHNYEWAVHWNGNNLVLVDDIGRVVRFTSNGAGTWTQQSNFEVPYQLEQDGQEIDVYDPDRRRFYHFDAYGRLESIYDGKGNVHTVTYTEFNGQPAFSVSDGLGRTIHVNFSIPSGTNVPKINQIFDTGFARSVSFFYQDPDHGENMTSVVDVRSNTTTYEYADAVGIETALLRYVQRPEGNIPYQQTYHDLNNQFHSGKVATQTDALGNTQSFEYSGNDTTITDPDTNDRVHTHDSDGALRAVTDESGNTITIGVDATSRRASIENRQGTDSGYSYDSASGNVASETDGKGNVTTYGYSNRVTAEGFTVRDLTSISYPDGSTETFTYDSVGNRTGYTDQSGASWSWTYNGHGQVLTETNPLGGVTTNVYNADGTLASRTDPASNTTTYQYDSLLRRNRITFADTSFQTFTYDNADNMLVRTNERGDTYTFSFDDNHNLATVTDGESNSFSYDYDDLDRWVGATDAQGETSAITFTNRGQIATNTDRRGNMRSFDYDVRGNYTEKTDEDSQVWQYAYGIDDWLTDATDPLGHTQTYDHDVDGLVTMVTSRAGRVTELSYDNRGRLSTLTEPSGREVKFYYDGRGLITKINVGSGAAITNFTRNGYGNVTKITDPKGKAWDFSYDTSGRLIERTDPLGNTTTYDYDNRNRLSVVTYPDAMGTLTYGYDAAGNVTSRSFSDGLTQTYGYDGNQLRTSATGLALAYDTRRQLVASNGLTMTRDAEGNIASITYAPGKTVTYTYDARGLVASVSDWAGGGVTFAYDDAGRPTTLTRSSGAVTSYGYDNDGYVTQVLDSLVSNITLVRGADGQVATAARNVPLPGSLSVTPRTFGADAASQAASFSYDAMGRATADNTRSFTWNLAGQLTKVTENANEVDYTYDALGALLTRTEGGNTRSFVWNYALDLPSVAVIKDQAVDQFYYIYTPDGRLLYSVAADSSDRRFYHFDEAGNTIFLTDNSQVLTDRYAYSPFGVLTDSTGSTDNPFTYVGQYGVPGDEDSGLYAMRQRVYDSRSRRFLSRDPLTGADPRNGGPYLYAANDPLHLVDPFGLGPDEATVAGQVTGDLGQALDTATNLNGTGLTPRGLGPGRVPVGTSGVAKLSKALGPIGLIISDGAEVARTNERMDDAENRLHRGAQAARDRYNKYLEEIRQLERTKKITREEARRRRREARERLNDEIDVANQRFEFDSIRAGTVASINIFINTVPFAGWFVNGDDFIPQYDP